MSRAVRLLLVAALALPAGTALPAAPATAAECPPAGGGSVPRASAGGDVVFRGGGWGHGLGMSQYGAQGAARLGCSSEQILTRYYAGTTITTAPMPGRIRLRMLDNGYRVDVEAAHGSLVWSFPGCVPPPPPPEPTTTATPASTPASTATSTAPAPSGPGCPPVQPDGAKWQLTLDEKTHQHFVLWNLDVLPKQVLWEAASSGATLRLTESGSVARLTTWRSSSIYLDRSVRWDRTNFSIGGGIIDAVQQVRTTERGNAMDKYLRGIAEVPSSFPPAALQAQAIAARTYAAKRAGRVLMPTPVDQNWTGWAKESEGPGGALGARWVAAVDATSGRVISSASTGAMIDAFYSSSMGGYTEDERYVWGVETPFLRPVDDSRWDAASDNPKDLQSWAVGVSWGSLASRLGFSRISSISVPPRGADARNAGVRVVGFRGGRLATSYVEGWDVREALGLLSPGFTVAMRRIGGPAAQPLLGDWDGDGRDQPGWFRNGRVALQMTNGARSWNQRFHYGRAGDVAVVGDWDRDGDDDLGVFRDGAWRLRTGLTGGAPTTTFSFGRAGDHPVVGRWTGHRLGVGIVRDGKWRLRKNLGGGPAQFRFRFGEPTDVPVTGSWKGGRRTGIGVERDGQWLLRNRPAGGAASITLGFGTATDRAVAGDPDGDGRSAPGAVRGRHFLSRTGLPGAESVRTLRFRG